MPFSIASITTSTVQCYVQYHSRLPPPLIPPSRDKRRHLIWRAISGFSENRNEKEEAKKGGNSDNSKASFYVPETEAVVSFVKPHSIAIHTLDGFSSTELEIEECIATALKCKVIERQAIKNQNY